MEDTVGSKNNPGENENSAFARLCGIAKDAFTGLGGGEFFIQSEREQFELGDTTP